MMCWRRKRKVEIKRDGFLKDGIKREVVHCITFPRSLSTRRHKLHTLVTVCAGL